MVDGGVTAGLEDSLPTETVSPVPEVDWYIPRSTKVMKEDLPEALTKPRDWYWRHKRNKQLALV
jgi:hypothetical protein